MVPRRGMSGKEGLGGTLPQKGCLGEESRPLTPPSRNEAPSLRAPCASGTQSRRRPSRQARKLSALAD